MKLHLISADNDEGDNLDLLTVSETCEDAIALWHQTYGLGPEAREWVQSVRMVLPDVSGTIHDGQARAVLWEDLTIEYERT